MNDWYQERPELCWRGMNDWLKSGEARTMLKRNEWLIDISSGQNYAKEECMIDWLQERPELCWRGMNEWLIAGAARTMLKRNEWMIDWSGAARTMLKRNEWMIDSRGGQNYGEGYLGAKSLTSNFSSGTSISSSWKYFQFDSDFCELQNAMCTGLRWYKGGQTRCRLVVNRAGEYIQKPVFKCPHPTRRVPQRTTGGTCHCSAIFFLCSGELGKGLEFKGTGSLDIVFFYRKCSALSIYTLSMTT
jgi:hypothetical protein